MFQFELHLYAFDLISAIHLFYETLYNQQYNQVIQIIFFGLQFYMLSVLE